MIESKKNIEIKRVKRLQNRQRREKEGVFLVEGIRLLREAVRSGAIFEDILFVESRGDEVRGILEVVNGNVATHMISERLMSELSNVVTSQGIIGVVRHDGQTFDELLSLDLSLVLVSSGVRDPGNLGTLLRVADAVGADGFISTPHCADIYNEKVVRSGAGAHFHIPVVRDIPLSDVALAFREREIKLFGLDPHAGNLYCEEDLTHPCAFVVGNEASGLGDEDFEFLDARLRIEMPGRAESLNVACAASVVLFEVLKQRNFNRGVGIGRT
ncbi:MAG: RNA methyltransferase [Actinomycetota bacterium]|nr:RNA methyltransferase [Actinomycetota bacterium]